MPTEHKFIDVLNNSLAKKLDITDKSKKEHILDCVNEFFLSHMIGFSLRWQILEYIKLNMIPELFLCADPKNYLLYWIKNYCPKSTTYAERMTLARDFPITAADVARS